MAIKNSWSSGEVLTAADLTDTFKGVYINAQTGTTYTLGTADSFVSISNASGGTVTIPTNTTAPFNTGAVVGIMNAGTTGTFTIAGAGGVTVNTTTGGTTLLPLETVYVVKLGTNTWQTKRDPGIANAGGLVYITGSTFSASSAVNVNNCFTSTYDSYQVRLSFTSSAANENISMRMRVGGTDTVGTGYNWQRLLAGGATVSATTGTSAGLWQIGAMDSGNRNTLRIDVFDPAAAIATTFQSQNEVGLSTQQIRVGGGFHTGATAFDGFSLLPDSGNITGTVRVYGYRNS